uniref:Ig-like domain-containing protein n=1 Tax=Fundulus heteroclitus TaxID=8078 RepID=A0A3Q2QPX5_FUNHE
MSIQMSKEKDRLLLNKRVQGENQWSVTYSPAHICAIKGMTVELHCNYTHPPKIDDAVIEVKNFLWFTKLRTNGPVDLKSDQDYRGRVEYKNNCTAEIRDVREIDSAIYKMRFITNHRHGKYTGLPGVHLIVSDMPKLPKVSLASSGEIVEGSSITLTCTSDANPAATYTWYKKNIPSPLSKDSQLVFRSTQSSDSGEYYCTAENVLKITTSKVIFIDVKYAPRLPLVSLTPSGEIVEGISLTLTCSSDANPAANYSWFKENDESAQYSRQNFTIPNIGPHHGGLYYCEAHNRRGSHKSAIHFTVVASKSDKASCSHIISEVPDCQNPAQFSYTPFSGD